MPRRLLLALSFTLATTLVAAQSLPTVNAAMEAVGTFSWVVHGMEYFGTAEAHGFRVVGTPYVSKQATEIALRSGEADVKVDDFLGPVLLRDAGIMASGIYPYATAVGGLVVPVDSDIQSIEDLRGRTVCFVDQASTSGYLVPMKGLMDGGIDLNEDLTPILAGGHDASLLTLDAGDCDAAFAHDTMLKTLEESGQVEPGSLRAVWESDPITEDPISVNRDSLDPELADQIIEVLREKASKPALVEAGICESEDDCVLPEEIEWGYLPVSDEDFDPIREICEVTQAEACQNVG